LGEGVLFLYESLDWTVDLSRGKKKMNAKKNINKNLKGGIWGEFFAIIASNRAQEC